MVYHLPHSERFPTLGDGDDHKTSGGRPPPPFQHGRPERAPRPHQGAASRAGAETSTHLQTSTQPAHARTAAAAAGGAQAGRPRPGTHCAWPSALWDSRSQTAPRASSLSGASTPSTVPGPCAATCRAVWRHSSPAASSPGTWRPRAPSWWMWKTASSSAADRKRKQALPCGRAWLSAKSISRQCEPVTAVTGVAIRISRMT